MGTSRILSSIAVAVMITACGGKAPAPSAAPQLTGTTDVVAIVNGVTITDAELVQAAKEDLKQFDMQVYKIKKGTLDDLVEQKLIEEAAKKDGKSVEAYTKINIDDKIKKLGEAEIRAFYESNKDRVGGKSFDEVKESISQFMNRGAAQSARNDLMAQLRKDAKVQIKLEPPRAAVETGDNPSMGPKDAPIVIVEFTDYECPFCGRVRPTITEVMDKYKDQIRYVLRDYPLPFHGNAKKAHEAAHCAGDQGKYWEMNKLLFQNQKAIGVSDLKKYAADIGLNQSKFDKCLDSAKHAKKVDDNQSYGGKVGVNGTPAFFVNGIALSGAQPAGAFIEIIDAELANKK